MQPAWVLTTAATAATRAGLLRVLQRLTDGPGICSIPGAIADAALPGDLLQWWGCDGCLSGCYCQASELRQLLTAGCSVSVYAALLPQKVSARPLCGHALLLVEKRHLTHSCVNWSSADSGRRPISNHQAEKEHASRVRSDIKLAGSVGSLTEPSKLISPASSGEPGNCKGCKWAQEKHSMDFLPPPSDVWARDMGNAEDPPDAALDNWLYQYMTETLGHAPQDQAMPPAALGMPNIEPGALATPPLHMGAGPGPDGGQELVSSTSNSAEHGDGATATAGGHTAHAGEDKAAQRALKVAEKNR